MKFKLTFLMFFFFIFAISASAQYEWETVYNPRTNQNEDRFNPYNSAQQAYERQREANKQNRDRNLEAINRAWEQSEQQRQNLAQQMAYMRMELQSRLNYGYAIIRAGKATTTYKPSPKFSLKNLFLEQAQTAEIKQLALLYAEPSLKEFNDELRKNGMPLNDYAEARALTFIICYEAYFGEKPTSTHLAAARQISKKSYLKDAVFQSYDDLERQQKVEPDEALAIYSLMLRRKGDAKSIAQAKAISKGILEKLWVNSVETIYMTKTSFMHKGVKIIEDGKATNLFKYNPNIQTAELMVKSDGEFRNAIIQDYKQNLQLYYQVLANKGGQKNDLAWCGTIVLFGNYYVLSKQEMNPTQLKNAYDLIKAAVFKSPDIQAASDESKQIACEQLAILTVSNYNKFTKGDFGAESIARGYLNELIKGLGEKPENYQLTANGIVKVR